MKTKTCSKCGVTKPRGDFERCGQRKDGYHNQCKACLFAWRKAYVAYARKHTPTKETKVCPRCHVEKPGAAYTRHENHVDGCASVCRECDKIRRIQLSEKHRKIYGELVHKVCRVCKKDKKAVEFQAGIGRRDGYSNECKECESKRKKAAWKAGLDHYHRNKEHYRDKQLKKDYGITLQEVKSLLVKQDGKCPICGTTKPGGVHNVFHVDHSKFNGAVRGLLCFRCNTLLGRANEDIELLQKIIKYIQRTREETLYAC